MFNLNEDIYSSIKHEHSLLSTHVQYIMDTSFFHMLNQEHVVYYHIDI
jgi:hypothetical protein